MEREQLKYDSFADYLQAYPEAAYLSGRLSEHSADKLYIHRGSGRGEPLPGGYIWVQRRDYVVGDFPVFRIAVGDATPMRNAYKLFKDAESRDAFWESLRDVPVFTAYDLVSQRGFHWV